MKRFKLFSSKTDFERMREHRDAIHVEEKRKKYPNYSLPEKSSDLVRGSRCGPDVIPDEDMLATHHDDGKKLNNASEYALEVPDADLKYANQERKLVDGTTHKYDLNGLYTELPGNKDDWKPAPKKTVATI